MKNGWSDILFRPSIGVQILHAYGLCWTTSRFDEPYWRMAGFQRPPPIVRIRCRAISLFDSCADSLKGQVGSLFIGTVQYRPQRRLLQLAERVASENHILLILPKLPAYCCTSESPLVSRRKIRLLWLDREQRTTSAKLVEIPSENLIQQVMISPYTDSRYRPIHKAVRSRTWNRVQAVCYLDAQFTIEVGPSSEDRDADISSSRTCP